MTDAQIKTITTRLKKKGQPGQQFREAARKLLAERSTNLKTKAQKDRLTPPAHWNAEAWQEWTALGYIDRLRLAKSFLGAELELKS